MVKKQILNIIDEFSEKNDFESLNSFIFALGENIDYEIAIKLIELNLLKEKGNIFDAYDFLMLYDEYEDYDPYWSYYMGLFFYFSYHFISAIKYFNKSIKIYSEIDLDDGMTEHPLYYISKCEDVINSANPIVGLNERALGFWKDFEENRDKIYELGNSDNQDDVIKISHFIKDLLLYYSLNYDIKIIRQKNNESIINNSSLFNISIKGADIEESNETTKNKTKNKVGIYFIAQYTYADSILLSQFLEFRNSDILNDNFEFAIFYKHLDNKNLGSSYFPFFMEEIYCFKDKIDYNYMRDDIISGKTYFSPLITDYINRETKIFDHCFDSGAVGISIVYKKDPAIEAKNSLDIRNTLEDILNDCKQYYFSIIGSAMGKFYNYIDLLVFDMDFFMEDIYNKLLLPKCQELNVKLLDPLIIRNDKKNNLLEDSAYKPMDQEECKNLENIKKSPKNIMNYSDLDKEILEKFITDNLGTISGNIVEIVPSEFPITIQVIEPCSERSYYTLITNGAGAYQRIDSDKINEYESTRCEFMISLPPQWDLKTATNENYWPIKLLKYLAQFSFHNECSIGCLNMFFQSLENGNIGLDERFDFYCCILLPPLDFEVDKVLISNEQTIRYLQLVQLYKEERDYYEEHGYKVFVDLLYNSLSVEEIYVLTPNRKNICI